jgi:hypothetical protein
MTNQLPQVSVSAITSVLAYDAGLESIKVLLSGLDPSVRTVAVDTNDDALATINAALAESGARKLMVLCHGQVGELRLGAQPIRREQLFEREATLASWGLESIELYACHAGADAAFVQTLEQLSGAKVAASSGVVGHASLGGSWTLQGRASNVIAPFSRAAIDQWAGTLGTSLVNGLGGSAGFGENFLSRNDDGSTDLIDIRPVFGEAGILFYGTYYTGLYVNNNGGISFDQPVRAFNATAFSSSQYGPLISPFWADIDTRSGPVTATPSGTSTGSNLVWYDLDLTSHTFTTTWDDVGYFSQRTNRLNAFQLSLSQAGNSGDFDIIFRYEEVNWFLNARAGYTAGNGVNFAELEKSGN